MYLPINFRLGGQMERSGGGGAGAPGPAPVRTVHNSAFKHTTPSDTLKPEPLPPISSLRTDGQAPPHARFPYAKPMCGPTPTQQQQALLNSIAHAQTHPSPFAPHQTSLPTPTSMALSPFSPPHNHVTHPAFAFPMGLPSFLPSAHPLSNSQLQQMMAADGGFVAQYLNSCDPLARAALMEITRMGHYPLGKKLFGCPQCRYITDRKNNLKRHVATMHQDCDKVLECCGILFKNKASLRDHVLIFHSNGYMCRFCGRNFCRKALLKRHLTVHSGQKDFACDQCDYATSHKSNLERHRKVHERQGEGSDDSSSNPSSPDKPNKSLSEDGATALNERLMLTPPPLNSPGSLHGVGISTIASHLGASAMHQLDFSKHFALASSQNFSVHKLKNNHAIDLKNKNTISDSDKACLIDLEDEFELNNMPINVVDIDV